MNQSNTSLIITTYNWKEALEKVIISVFRQTILPTEIIIADDGSRDDAREMIDHLKKNSPVEIIHSWQEDKGFRAAMSRNKAIAKSKSDYIILLDGDCMLHPKFIQDHISHRTRDTFVIGPRVILPPSMPPETINLNSLFLKLDIKNRKNCVHSPIISKILSYHTHSLRAIRSCNMGIWKKDIISINGFNEDFEGWGREDSEFASRLLNSGISRKNILFSAICYHLFHNENDRSRLSTNDNILINTINQKLTTCLNGINKYLNPVH